MQMNDLPERERWSAIAELQRTMVGSNPGSLRHDSADHAVELALRSERPVRSREYLAKNLLRDAGRTVLRRQRQARRQEVPSDLHRPCDRRPSDPAGALIAADLKALLLQRLAVIPSAVPCLNAMLEGEAAARTAHRLGVPDHRVEYLRGQIRQLARAYM